MLSGTFISFEGPDGAGKTSALQAITAEIAPALGDRLTITREPGGNPISESIRSIILDRANTAMDYRTEALLYAAARRQHLAQTILPALAADKLVLCDRYVDSSVAYQGAGREIGEAAVAKMNEFATDGLLPELTIYFDVPAEVGLRRIQAHRDPTKVDRLDVEQTAFHDRVRAAYLKLQAAHPDRIKLIDATQDPATVVAQSLALIKQTAPAYF
ncbi:MAG: dTMP kinase [Levilactobacillus sp.]|jgi:dTMP kinase|uniref:dTMP kinase n=1 Tax=Levilactobacillus sp. TaxID=2767919 RepID=UPI002582B72C|nr:dTMP kinase [Levilactobacillus sp.]MCH4124082.1 dTMP kinase [Levilactobacillus sp.]MCI1554082.1 dTMP kinase [Levilactobacillus sp.]MCI1598474.1 dTMP kinase [Levilactobacillus sp.]MCI1606003.1 dTMP kinase [Levilactobacillus sp.]